ncbi:MAG: type II secretion system protein [Pseudomonadota bacterium]|nr:type II secretion system protein [Pseudomonadota bacterium]
MPSLAKGFTLVELIGVIAIAGILAAVAAPRFFNTATFASRGYFDAAAGFLRYAQKLAIARHGNVAVLVNTSGLTLCSVTTSPCPVASQILGPDGNTPFQALVPNGVSLAGSVASFSFDAQGRPNTAAILTITGDQTRTLTVEAETGYVH